LYPQAYYGKPLAAVDAPGYGYFDQPSPAADPGYANGGWNPGQPGGRGAGGRETRPGYPPSGSYRSPDEPGW
jgi:hypothetical protein